MGGNIGEVSKSLRWLVYISLGLLMVSAITGISIVVILFKNQDASVAILQQLNAVVL